MKKHLRLSAAAFVLLSALAVSSLAPCSINAAEQKVGGTAAKAEYKHKKGQYKVEVVKDTEVFDVIVDANDGTVLSVKKDAED